MLCFLLLHMQCVRAVSLTLSAFHVTDLSNWWLSVERDHGHDTTNLDQGEHQEGKYLKGRAIDQPLMALEREKATFEACWHPFHRVTLVSNQQGSSNLPAMTMMT